MNGTRDEMLYRVLKIIKIRVKVSLGVIIYHTVLIEE
jgi:hypothetical protein